jgi:3D-(3,5/4)-trihydroxycyclohexane-1,2-dione acylhydrolase (decyclizing)
VKAALERARKADRITVVVVPADPESRMPGMGTWWDVPVAEVSSVDQTKATRANYEEATKKQRPVLA